ncbi:DnaJ (Hsp40), sub C, member 2 [Cyanidiococcus yangmingshanensis]|uniref:DnaJ homolog subfamily C member 2 n=1 Tax=Cyanidiococcus yangmingshanensis TaxID=2690220 RepID=A0A7J7ICQ7_9RHOD|nr:DnaJ (Hsp40), sub C, member 2 [Cyanidiococcus yangmingshanensis]
MSECALDDVKRPVRALAFVTLLPTVAFGAVSLRQRRVECAGWAFFYQFERVERENEASDHVDGAVSSTVSESCSSGASTTPPTATTALAASLLAAARESDWYRLLGLEQTRYQATVADIRRAYKEVSRAVHPDRVVRWPPAARLQAQEVFQRLQQAMRVLLHPQRRCLYDSMDGTFDDRIPDADTSRTEDEFYTVFGAAFERNARWSRQQPVPQLGNADTPDAQVRRFYAFWQAFDSWREFPDEDDDQIWDDLSMTREERRWHERQQRKERARRRQAERARLRQLVETCYRLDPRIRRMREAERERKAEERAARRRFRQKWLEDDAANGTVVLNAFQNVSVRATPHVMSWQETSAGRTVAADDQTGSQSRAEMRRTNTNDCSSISDPSASRGERLATQTPRHSTEKPNGHQDLASALMTNAAVGIGTAEPPGRHQGYQAPDLHPSMSAEHGRTLSPSETTSARAPAPSASPDSVERANMRDTNAASVSCEVPASSSRSPAKDLAQEGVGMRAVDAPSASGASKETWSTTGLALLSRALKKFPVGTRDRWTRIAEALQHRYSPEEIRAQAHALMRAPCSRTANLTPPNAASWTIEEQRQLEEALRQFGPSHGAARWRLVATLVPTRSAAACAARFAELRAFYASTGVRSSTSTSSATAAAAAAMTIRKTSSVSASLSRGS